MIHAPTGTASFVTALVAALAFTLFSEALRAPGELEKAVAEAGRRKREGEEKLGELETCLAQAKSNEHLMDPYQRQRFREYEYQPGNARYGFFGATG